MLLSARMCSWLRFAEARRNRVPLLCRCIVDLRLWYEETCEFLLREVRSGHHVLEHVADLKKIIRHPKNRCPGDLLWCISVCTEEGKMNAVSPRASMIVLLCTSPRDTMHLSKIDNWQWLSACLIREHSCARPDTSPSELMDRWIDGSMDPAHRQHLLSITGDLFPRKNNCCDYAFGSKSASHK